MEQLSEGVLPLLVQLQNQEKREDKAGGSSPLSREKSISPKQSHFKIILNGVKLSWAKWNNTIVRQIQPRLKLLYIVI